MRILTFFIVSFLCFSKAHSQYIEFSDPGMEFMFLERTIVVTNPPYQSSYAYADLNSDGKISYEEADQIIGLSLDWQGFDGIEHLDDLCSFTNITFLELGNLDIDVSLPCISAINHLRGSLDGTLDITGFPNLEIANLSDQAFGDSSSSILWDFALTPKLIDVEFIDHSFGDIDHFILPRLDHLVNLEISADIKEFTILDTLPELVNMTLDLYVPQEITIEKAPKLENLILEKSELREITLINLPSLTNLYLHDNNLTEFRTVNLPKLKILDLSENKLSEFILDESNNLPSLQNLDLSDNRVSNFEINVENLDSLLHLNLNTNELDSLDLSQMINLQTLQLNHNQLGSLNLTMVKDLVYFECILCELDSIDLSENRVLETLNINLNNLTSLDLTNQVALSELHYYNQQDLTSLDLSNNINLKSITSGGNNIETIDLSYCEKLEIIRFASETDDYPRNLLIKNNAEPVLFLAENSSIQYICTKEDRIGHYKVYCNECEVNAFCNFDSVYQNNVLLADIRYDALENNCESGSSPIEYGRVEVSNGSSVIGSIFSNLHGKATLITDIDTLQISPSSPTELFIYTPNNQQIIFEDGNIDTIYSQYCLSNNGEIKDLEIHLIPINDCRPGFVCSYDAVIKNVGNLPMSGNFQFSYPQDSLTFNSSSIDPMEHMDGMLTFPEIQLNPFENQIISIIFQSNNPMETPPVNGGDIFTFNANIITGDDGNQENNSDYLHQEVVNSYDPNDKTALVGDSIFIDKLSKDFIYTIRFENLGSSYAQNVVLSDTIQSDIFDINSLQIIDASHEMEVEIKKENRIDFIFQDIFLSEVDSINDGFVVFSLKPKKENLTFADVLTNEANIYFDFNWPILTNLAETSIYDNIHFDADLDGFYTPEDCDDQNPDIHPNQEEIPYNGVDDDCNEITLDDDLDQDGFDLVDDCDDQNPEINNGANEIPYNAIDDDCNEATLDDDLDQDGFGIDEDCDDENANVYPGAAELAENGIDEDCDGEDWILSDIDNSFYRFGVYPNPASSIVNFFMPANGTFTFAIYNATGSLEKSGKCGSSIQVNDLENGIYSLVIEEIVSQKFLIQKLVIIK